MADMVNMGMLDHNIFIYVDASDDKIIIFDLKKNALYNI